MNGLKDTLTTVFGIVLVLATAVNTYLESLCATCTVEFLPLVIAIVVAAIAYFTGKNGNGSTKERLTIH